MMERLGMSDEKQAALDMRMQQPGLTVGLGKDHTLFTKLDGKVRFEDHGQHGR